MSKPADYFGDIEFTSANVDGAGAGRAWMNHFAGRSYYTLQYQHYGRIRFFINNGEEFMSDAPSLLITRPGADCHFGDEKSPWHHSYLGFRGIRVEKLLAQGLLPIPEGKETAFYKIKDGEIFLALFRQCVGHVRASNPLENAFAANSLERLLLHLASELESPNARQRSSRLDNLILQMRASPMGGWNFAQIARKSGMSEGHFARLFKEAAGMPPKRFLQKCRIDLAAEMLASTPDPIKNVAEAAGFDDLQYFYRKFKEAHAMAPAAFRRLRSHASHI